MSNNIDKIKEQIEMLSESLENIKENIDNGITTIDDGKEELKDKNDEIIINISKIINEFTEEELEEFKNNENIRLNGKIISGEDFLEEIEEINIKITLNDNNEDNKLITQQILEATTGDVIDKEISKLFIMEKLDEIMTRDIKSDLTEEFAWYYDYIRNVIDENEQEDLVELLEDVIKEDNRNLTIRSFKSGSLNQIFFKKLREGINKNQKENKFDEVFTKKGSFKKATGGLPDVISISKKLYNGEKKLNFTAANSLFNLNMESDQMERHAFLIANSIRLNGGKIDEKLSKIIEESISDNVGNDKQRKFFNDENTEEHHKIMKAHMNITFFQTFSIKKDEMAQKQLDEILEKEGIEENEGKRILNHQVRNYTANSQVYNNLEYENYNKAHIGGQVKALNQRISPTNITPQKEEAELLKKYIENIIVNNENNDEFNFNNYLEKLNPTNTGNKKLSEDNKILIIFLEKYQISSTTTKEDLIFLQKKYKKLVKFKKQNNFKDKREELYYKENKDIIEEYEKFQEYYEKQGYKTNKDGTFQSNKIKEIYKKVMPAYSSISQENYKIMKEDLTSRDFSIIATLNGTETMKAAIFTNLIISFEELYKKENDISKKEKIVRNMEGVIKYAKNRMINFGNVDTRSLGQKVTNNRTQVENEKEKVENEKEKVEKNKEIQEKDIIISFMSEGNGPGTPDFNKFFKEVGKTKNNKPIYGIKENIILSELLKAIDMNKSDFKEEYSILYEEFKTNEENAFKLASEITKINVNLRKYPKFNINKSSLREVVSKLFDDKMSVQEKKEKFKDSNPILYKKLKKEEDNEIATIFNGEAQLTEIEVEINENIGETITLKNQGGIYYSMEKARSGFIINKKQITNILNGIETEVKLYKEVDKKKVISKTETKIIKVVSFKSIENPNNQKKEDKKNNPNPNK